jgi:hypothetical protein
MTLHKNPTGYKPVTLQTLIVTVMADCTPDLLAIPQVVSVEDDIVMEFNPHLKEALRCALQKQALETPWWKRPKINIDRLCEALTYTQQTGQLKPGEY